MAKLPKYQSGGRVSAPSFNMSPYIQSDIYTDMLKTQDEYKNLFKRREDIVSEDIEGKTAETKRILAEANRTIANILGKKDRSFLGQLLKVGDFATNFFPEYKLLTTPLKMRQQVGHAKGQQKKAQEVLANFMPDKFRGTIFQEGYFNPSKRDWDLKIDELKRSSDLDFIDYAFGAGESFLEAYLNQDELEEAREAIKEMFT